MRINQFLALATGMGRRAADREIESGRVLVNGNLASLGQTVSDADKITFGGHQLEVAKLLTQQAATVIAFNKPTGYVVSRHGQGNKTIYDLLPVQYRNLKPIGRLDKNSSGLLLLTDDGYLAQELTHPSKQKIKVYEITLDKPLQPLHHQMISDHGIQLEDGSSQLHLERLQKDNNRRWRVVMHEGRNRQIRRTFQSLGYKVIRLHRTQFGAYDLANLKTGEFRIKPSA